MFAPFHCAVSSADGSRLIFDGITLEQRCAKVHKHEANYYEQGSIDSLLDCLEAEYNVAVREAGGMEDTFSFENLNSRQRTEIFTAYMRRSYILLALVSACRRSELIGLRVDDIDFEDNRILIKQTGHYTVENGLYFVDHLKNGSRSKSIDMPILMMEQLKVSV